MYPFEYGKSFVDKSPTDQCLRDLDRILAEEQDPGAHPYLVPGTVPIKEKKPGVLGAQAFFVLGTVPIKKKRLQVKPQGNKHNEALEQCRNQSCVYIYLNVSQSNRAIKNYASVLGISMAALAISCC